MFKSLGRSFAGLFVEKENASPPPLAKVVRPIKAPAITSAFALSTLKKMPASMFADEASRKAHRAKIAEAEACADLARPYELFQEELHRQIEIKNSEFDGVSAYIRCVFEKADFNLAVAKAFYAKSEIPESEMLETRRLHKLLHKAGHPGSLHGVDGKRFWKWIGDTRGMPSKAAALKEADFIKLHTKAFWKAGGVGYSFP